VYETGLDNTKQSTAGRINQAQPKSRFSRHVPTNIDPAKEIPATQVLLNLEMVAATESDELTHWRPFPSFEFVLGDGLTELRTG
jgi:hypothetical protein